MSEVTAAKNVIRDLIGELIEKLKSDIDLDQVKAVCKEQYGIETTDRIDLESGDIVNYNGQIAFKLDLKICFDLSLIINRNGNFIKIDTLLKNVNYNC